MRLELTVSRWLACTLAAFILSLPAVAAAQVTLPFTEDFEGTNGETYTTNTASLTGAPEWSVEIGPNGRLRMNAGTGYAETGTGAATLDKDPSGTPTTSNFLILTLDMTNYNTATNAVALDFSFQDHGEESHPNDRIWVRGSNTDTWVQIYDLAANQGTNGLYQQVVEVDITNALIGASQQFTNTFQIRFGQEDDFPSTSLTLSDGYTFDNIVVKEVLTDDVAVTNVLSPVGQGCGETAQDVEVEITNIGALSQSNIPVQVDITGDISQTFNGTIAGPLAKNASDTLVFGPINTFDGANITITATASQPGDLQPNNDTLVTTPTVKPTSIAFTSPAAVCPGGLADIAVTVEPDTDYKLWDMPTMGMELSRGFTLTTPPVTAQTTYYIERASLIESNGAADDMIGMGANYPTLSDGLVFDVTQPVILDAVNVYPGSTGDVVVRVLDQSDSVVATSSPVTIVAADIGNAVRIPIAASLSVGVDYKLDAEGSTVTTLYRNNTGAMYPYTSSSISITGAKNDLPDSYYFFYDWEIVQDIPLCVDERTPVTVDVDANACSADVSVAIAGPASADPGMSVEYTVTVTNDGPTVASGVSLDLPTPTGATFVSNGGDCDTAYPCALGDVQSGTTLTITSTYTIDGGFDGTASFTATATSTAPDPSPGDESATQDTSVMGMGVGGGPGVGGASTTNTTTTSGAGGSATSGAGGGSTGAGGDMLDAEDDGGCSCSTPGGRSGNGAPPGLLLVAGLAFASMRRRRR